MGRGGKFSEGREPAEIIGNVRGKANLEQITVVKTETLNLNSLIFRRFNEKKVVDPRKIGTNSSFIYSFFVTVISFRGVWNHFYVSYCSCAVA